MVYWLLPAAEAPFSVLPPHHSPSPEAKTSPQALLGPKQRYTVLILSHLTRTPASGPHLSNAHSITYNLCDRADNHQYNLGTEADTRL